MKFNRFLFTLSGICCFWVLNAQKEGNVWHFGRGLALDFNSGAAVLASPSSMETFEGCASIADANGNLLFYTNGGGRDPILSGQSSGIIWNRNHQVMYDMGNTEGGGFSAAQSAVVIPKPGVVNQYYLFTMEEVEFDVGGSVPGQPLGRGLSYFEVDMSLNGGLGGVVAYEPSILVPSYEGLCVVRNANGSDYWVIVHNAENGLAVFPVSSSGVGAPVFYNLPDGSFGSIKASPDGKWLSFNQGNNNHALCSFNAANGSIGAVISLGEGIQATEFSPKSKRLFVTTDNSNIRYFDLNSSNIPGSVVTVATTPGMGIINGQMQLAPDGKIYFIQVSFFANVVYLSTIICPDAGALVEFNKFSFNVQNGDAFFGLPNFDNAIFRKDSDPPLAVDLGADQTLCAGQTAVLGVGINNATYLWSTGAQSQTINVDVAGTYIVTVTAPGCGVGVDTVVVDEIQLNVNAGSDQDLCAGSSLQLNATGNGTLSWSPAMLVSDATIAAPFFTGSSSVDLVLTATQGACSASDTVAINVFTVPVVNIAPADTTIEAGASVLLSVLGMGDFQWSVSTGLSCTNCSNPVASPDTSTTYQLTVTNMEGCTSSSSVTITVIPPDCIPEVPNAFTPNGDMVNDVFQPIGAAIESYELTIYNRWGEAIYAGNSAWDGRLNNKEAPTEVYVYNMNVRVCNEIKAFSGDLTLIR